MHPCTDYVAHPQQSEGIIKRTTKLHFHLSNFIVLYTETLSNYKTFLLLSLKQCSISLVRHFSHSFHLTPSGIFHYTFFTFISFSTHYLTLYNTQTNVSVQFYQVSAVCIVEIMIKIAIKLERFSFEKPFTTSLTNCLCTPFDGTPEASSCVHKYLAAVRPERVHTWFTRSR